MNLLKLEELCLGHQSKKLVNGLSFTLSSGETLGLVGESGSGKSLTSLALMGLLPAGIHATGSLRFRGKDYRYPEAKGLETLRGRRIAMIFQEPMSALNPSMRCGRQCAEVMSLHRKPPPKARKKAILDWFVAVGLPRPEAIFRAYPHQLSGGQKQRVMIAMALAGEPDLLIADEPTTALDLSVQRDILNLLKNLQAEKGMAMLFISHDLQVVQKVSDRVLVLYRGETMESGSATQILNQPQHPYTQGLLACRPDENTFDRRLPLVRDFLSYAQPGRELISPAVKEKRSLALTQNTPLLAVKKLERAFALQTPWWRKPQTLKAVDQVSFSLFPGESLGLVGESGSGKTTLGRILVGLEKAEAGSIFFAGKDIAMAPRTAWRQLNRRLQIIFQDPFSSLNPRLSVGEAIAEVLRQRQGLKHKAARAESENLLEKVGLLAEYYPRFPHEFSGGQRQRLGIARALAVKPDLLVCDESVSALDVSVQAQILNLLNDLKEEFGLTYLFISHDLNVVRYFCDRILVLKNGQLVESGLSEEVYRRPKMPYTRQLVEAGKLNT